MKNALFILIAVAVLVSCKTAKHHASAYQPAIEKVKTSESTKKETVIVTEKTALKTPIVVRSENLSVAEGEDQTQGKFDFYVIIGSFAGSENAHTLKSQLQSKGFSPVIMSNEKGMFRVSVMQTNDETEAREMVGEIRSKFEEHKDVWLLKRK